MPPFADQSSSDTGLGSSLATIARNLEPRGDGLWTARAVSSVAYPDEASGWFSDIEGRSFWFRHRNDCVSAVVSRFPPGGTLFDVGGGNGFVSLGLRRAGFDAVVVEPSPEGARNALARGLRPVICSTLENVGFAPSSLHAAGLFNVLEHIPDHVGFLRLLRGYIRPGGRVYATVPAYQSLWSVEDDYAGHQRRYTLRTLRAAFEEAAFEVEYATHFFTPLPLPILLLRALPSRLGLRRTVTREREEQEHGTGSGALLRVVTAPLRAEVAALRRGISLPFGGSCLIVGRVPSR